MQRITQKQNTGNKCNTCCYVMCVYASSELATVKQYIRDWLTSNAYSEKRYSANMSVCDTQYALVASIMHFGTHFSITIST